MSLKPFGRKLFQVNEPFPNSQDYMVFAKQPAAKDWTHIYFIYALSQDAAAVVARNLIPQDLSDQVVQLTKLP